ncbi:MAG: alpha/beta hydrolase family protein [Sphingopyxis sp.]
MKLRPIALASAALIAALPLTASQSTDTRPAPPTIAQLAAFPRMSSFDVSPDGQHIVALEARGEDRVILVWRTDAMNAAPTVIGASQMKIAGVQFVKNDRLGVSLWQPYDVRGEGVTKTFIGKLFITDLEGRDWREPLPLPRARTEAETQAQARTSPSVLDTLPNDPDDILVVNNVGTNAGDVFRVNVRTNRAERVQRSDEDVAGYVTDANGQLRARSQYGTDGNGAFIVLQIRNPQSGNWEEHFRSYVKDRDATEVIGFTSDANIALIRSNRGRDKAAIYEYDISARQMGEALFQHRYFDAADVRTFPYQNGGERFGEIIGLSYNGPLGDDVTWTSPQFIEIDRAIRTAMNITTTPLTVVDPANGQRGTIQYTNDKAYRLISYSADLKRVIFAVSASNLPPSYYLLNNGRLTLLSATYPDVDARSLGKTALVYYPARDGQTIPAFLTKPAEALCGAGPWPTVIHPHGGPWARDEMAFDGSMWVPLMSSRCMAVLQPQYRGSDGWGRHLWMAGDAEWGQKMQDDKDDGVRWLIEQRVAIPGRVAMFGFSYGGYASMAAAVRPNGLYKCAIAGAGVSDIRRIWSRFYTNPFFRGAQGPTVAGLSPVDQAAHIQIPIMVYHGDRDRTVPIEQSEWFVRGARQSGQPVVYHEIQDYAHGPAWTRAIMAEQLGYIDDYLRNGCGTGGL